MPPVLPPAPRARLGLESLEGRVVPATVTTIREATGATAAAVQATVDAFRSALGTLNPNTAGSVGSGRREINWDGTPTASSAPNNLAPDFFNTNSPRGVVFGTPGTAVQVSGSAADVGAGGVRFGTTDATYPTAFATFSAQKLFTAVGSNVVDVRFFIPGSTTPAVTRGFGAAFTDVDTAGSTRIDFYDENDNLVFGRDVLATAGDGSLSFLGVVFRGNSISRVRITSGAAALAAGVGDVTQGGTADLAVMDDFIYAEPVLPNLTPVAVGGQTNGQAVTFTPDRATAQYPAAPTATVNPFGGPAVNVRTAVGDVDGDAIPDTILVTGPGVPTRVAVVSGADNTTVLVQPFAPFAGSEDFAGGGFVAAADVTGDGNVEFAVTPDQGGGPRVVILSRNADGTVNTRANFFGITDDPNFRGGARAAFGDVDGDGDSDLVVGAGFLGGPRVAVFDGATLLGTPAKLVNDFFAFTGSDVNTLRNGVFVAAGDVNGDNRDDLIFGGGPGGAPRVFILSGQLVAAGDVAGAQNSPVANFFVAGNDQDRGGVRVAATDADGDARADVAAGSGDGAAARVRVYRGSNFTATTEPTTFQDLSVFGGVALANGVFVG